MNTLLVLLLILLITANFRMLASSRIATCIQTMAFQALILGALTLIMHWSEMNLRLSIFIVLTVLLKTKILPSMLTKAADDSQVRRIVEPFIGFTTSMLVGTVLLGVCYGISGSLQSARIPESRLLVSASFFTIMTGLLIIISRRKALMQVVGYLCMENGIYAFGVALAISEPLLIEMGTLLDIFVGVFVMGIAIYHINKEFDHIDTDKLSALKD